MSTSTDVGGAVAGMGDETGVLSLISRYATELSPLPLAATEGNTHIIRYANAAFCRLTGKEQEQLIGHPFAEVVPEGATNGCRAMLDQVFDTSETESLAEQEHEVGAAAGIFWSYTAWKIPGEPRRPAGLMIQVTDTTEAVQGRLFSKAVNEALVISNLQQHELTELADAVSQRIRQAMRETDHRVRNNLQSIAALLDLHVLANPETVPIDKLAQVRTHINMVVGIHDILTQDVKPDPWTRILTAREMLQKLLPMAQRVVGAQGLQWSTDDLRLTVKQGISLGILINELITNSIKHGAKSVTLQLKGAGEEGTLEVCDDGPGFPSSFDPQAAAHFGLELVESVSRFDLRGKTTYSNRAEGGARVAIMFPVRAPSDGHFAVTSFK